MSSLHLEMALTSPCQPAEHRLLSVYGRGTRHGSLLAAPRGGAGTSCRPTSSLRKAMDLSVPGFFSNLGLTWSPNEHQPEGISPSPPTYPTLPKSRPSSPWRLSPHITKPLSPLGFCALPTKPRPSFLCFTLKWTDCSGFNDSPT